MKNIEVELSSEVKLTTLVQTIYNESIEMGFKSPDYVKLMNELLDMTMNNSRSKLSSNLGVVNNNNNKISNLPISTKNLVIRSYNPNTDKKYVSKWFSEENNSLFLLSTSTKRNLDIKNIETDDRNIFATITLSDKTPIGLLALLNIDRDNSKGEMRKMIGEIAQRGKGFAKEASEIWLKYCTDILGLNKIYINTIETNFKNISLNRQLGLKIEGLLKREVIIENVEHDILRMAYLKR